MKKLSSSQRYGTFSNKRDAALEFLLVRARAKTADKLRKFMNQVQGEVARTYPMLNKQDLDPYTYNQIKHLDAAIDRMAYSISLEMSLSWLSLRSRVYMLSNASEQQAIINAQGGSPKKVPRAHVEQTLYSPTDYGAISDRAYFAMSRLRRDIMDAVEMSRIMGDELKDAMDRVLKIFPNPQKVKKIKKLKRLKEADKKDYGVYSLPDFLTEEEAQELMDEYESEFVPEWRDPRTGEFPDPVSIGEEGEYITYPWQLEQEMTDDFMKSVRAGTHEGAKAQGITDMVWIAVLGAHGKGKDDACQYCYKRDGLTTAEIEANLKGPWSDDPEWSRKSVTPLHPNCFCRLVPTTKDLPDMPESNEADFEDWLNT